ncbi:MAG: cation diffusion facilitator family transporter [Elusimicrobiales bacterium]|nr:cation diffusion facilitator family transporter [Elusimicrobiales bacterium]
MKNNAEMLRKKIWVVKLSVASNTALVIFKVIVGFAIGSVSVLSEAIHSGIDLVAALIAWFAVRSAGKPADKEHRYGHGKFENVSGFVEALLIFGAAAWIIYEAAHKLRNPQPIGTIGWGILVMALSSFVNMAVSSALFRIGNATDSVAIKADAWHLRTDVYTSLGVMAGLGLIWFFSFFFHDHDLLWIDPVAAILVALLIIKAAYDLTVQSLGDLLDISLPEAEAAEIEKAIKSEPGAISYKNLRTRKSGAVKFVDFDLLVDGSVTVDAAHAITDRITEALEGRLGTVHATIHIEPCKGACPEDCLPACSSPAKKAL